MTTIGVRELRQNASRYLKLVEQGETIEVTARGRPVARLVPLKAQNRLDELASQGRLIRAADHGDFLDEDPLPPRSGQLLPSEILAALRRDER